MNKLMNIRSLKDSLKPHFRTSFNTHFFPALFLRKDLAPTIVLFQNGKYSIIGAKSENEAQITLDFLQDVLASSNNSYLS